MADIVKGSTSATDAPRAAERDALALTESEIAALTIQPRRHLGRWITVVLLLAFLAVVARSLWTNPYINWAAIPEYVFSPEILLGLRNTLIVTALAMGFAVVVGTVVAAMRVSGNPVARSLAWAYAFFFRSVPALVLLFFTFNLALVLPTIEIGIPFTSIHYAQIDTNDLMTPLFAAVLALGISESAYYAEIVRSGLISVESGQKEAAQALGMGEFQTFRKIVIPQATRIILPPTGNELIGLLKYSSLASIIGFNELAGTAQQIYGVTTETIELLFVITFWYLVCTSVLSVAQYYLERRFGRGYARSSQGSRSLLSLLRTNLKPWRS